MTGSRCVEAFGLWRPEGSLQPCGRIRTRYSTRLDLEGAVKRADVVIGAVLLDISIDQGGCFETSRETKHSDPVYEVDGVLHYAVGNIPGAVPRTSTSALTNVTLPYVLAIAEHGVDGAVDVRPALRGGINVRGGEVVHPVVAQALGGR